MEIKSIIGQLAPVIHLICKLDRNSAITGFASLMHQPEMHPHSLRIEIILHLVFIYSHGSKALSKHDIAFIYKGVGKVYGCLEDPPEGVFTANIMSKHGNHVILEGIWESSAYFLQKVIDIIQEMPETNDYLKNVSTSTFALLTLSTLHCDRLGLKRNIKGSVIGVKKLAKHVVNDALTSSKIYGISKEEFYSKGFTRDSISEFIYTGSLEHVVNNEIGHSLLERFPVIEENDSFYLALPNAVSAAIRRFVYEKIDATGWIEILITQLYSKELDDVHNSLILKGRQKVIENQYGSGFLPSLSSVYKIEDGVYFHVIALFDPLTDFREKGLSAPYTADGTHLNTIISKDMAELEQKLNYKARVYTLCVVCGYGSGFYASYPNDGMVEITKPADFDTLNSLTGMSMIRFLSIMDYQNDLRACGIGVVNAGGFINAAAHVLTTKGRFFSDPSITNGTFSILTLATDFSLESRYEAICNSDCHVVKFTDGNYYPVSRFGKSYFEDISDQNIYFSIEHARKGYLLGLYEKDDNFWWMSIVTDNPNRSEMLYDLWKNSIQWLNHVGHILSNGDRQIIERSNVHFIINLKAELPNSFKDTEALQKYTFENIIDSIDSNSQTNVIRITLNEMYFNSIARNENIAEKAFVYHVVKNILAVCGIKDQDPMVLTNCIVHNSNMRYQHGFRQDTSRLYFAPFVKENIIRIDPIEMERKKFELSYKAFGKSTGGKRLEGKDNCINGLKILIDTFIKDIVLSLRVYNRHKMVELALVNHEQAELLKEQWTRTARALTAIHGDNERTRIIISEEKSKLNGLSLSSRIIAELANSECSTIDGLTPGDVTLSKLMASVSLLLRVAGISDALRWDAIRPYIEISAYGDVRYEQKFIESVIDPLGIDTMFKTISLDILNADSYYGDYLKSVGERPASDLEPEFLDAWKEEVGATISEVGHFFSAFVNKGEQLEKMVLSITRSEAMELVRSDSNLNAETITQLLDYFTLKPRGSWDEHPLEIPLSEVLPWRFRRSQSLIRKPIVNIHDDNLIIAPGLCCDSFVNLLHGLYGSIFPTSQLKNKMRKWSGYIINKSGTEFANKVADVLKKLGWHAEVEVKITKILGRSFDKDYGDVDVLAWLNDRVLVMECKNLQVRKTFYEIAEQLSDYRGIIRDNGKPDDLLKHINRFDLLSKNTNAVKKYLRMATDLRIESHLVFSTPVPMQYSVDKEAHGVSVHVFDSINKEFS